MLISAVKQKLRGQDGMGALSGMLCWGSADILHEPEGPGPKSGWALRR